MPPMPTQTAKLFGTSLALAGAGAAGLYMAGGAAKNVYKDAAGYDQDQGLVEQMGGEMARDIAANMLGFSTSRDSASMAGLGVALGFGAVGAVFGMRAGYNAAVGPQSKRDRVVARQQQRATRGARNARVKAGISQVWDRAAYGPGGIPTGRRSRYGPPPPRFGRENVMGQIRGLQGRARTARSKARDFPGRVGRGIGRRWQEQTTGTRQLPWNGRRPNATVRNAPSFGATGRTARVVGRDAFAYAQGKMAPVTRRAQAARQYGASAAGRGRDLFGQAVQAATPYAQAAYRAGAGAARRGAAAARSFGGRFAMSPDDFGVPSPFEISGQRSAGGVTRMRRGRGMTRNGNRTLSPQMQRNALVDQSRRIMSRKGDLRGNARAWHRNEMRISDLDQTGLNPQKGMPRLSAERYRKALVNRSTSIKNRTTGRFRDNVRHYFNNEEKLSRFDRTGGQGRRAPMPRSRKGLDHYRNQQSGADLFRKYLGDRMDQAGSAAGGTFRDRAQEWSKWHQAQQTHDLDTEQISRNQALKYTRQDKIERYRAQGRAGRGVEARRRNRSSVERPGQARASAARQAAAESAANAPLSLTARLRGAFSTATGRARDAARTGRARVGVGGRAAGAWAAAKGRLATVTGAVHGRAFGAPGSLGPQMGTMSVGPGGVLHGPASAPQMGKTSVSSGHRMYGGDHVDARVNMLDQARRATNGARRKVAGARAKVAGARGRAAGAGGGILNRARAAVGGVKNVEGALGLAERAANAAGRAASGPKTFGMAGGLAGFVGGYTVAKTLIGSFTDAVLANAPTVYDDPKSNAVSRQTRTTNSSVQRSAGQMFSNDYSGVGATGDMVLALHKTGGRGGVLT